MVADLVCLIDGDGYFQYLSPACEPLFGLPGEALRFRSCLEFIHPDDLIATLEAFDARKHQKSMGVLINRYLHRDGRYRWLEWKIVLVDDLFWATARDITALRAAEDELRLVRGQVRDVTMAGNEFLSVIGHEIRTPMHVVLGMCGILLESDLDPEQHHFATLIQQAGHTLMEMVNDLVDLSRIESGVIALKNEAIHPAEIVRKAVENRQIAALRKDVVVQEQIDPTLIDLTVSGDPERLQQILHHLIDHAVQSAHPDPVTVGLSRWRTDSDALLFTISAVGVEQGFLAPFEQANGGSRRHEGRGVAMAVARRLVERMGGWIERDHQQGEGRHFSFVLPVVPSVRLPTGAVAGEVGSDQKSLDILLVENFEDNQILCEAYLRRTPHRLTLVGDGLEAIARVQQERFDVVLMDIQMPNLDGMEATRRIRLWEQESGQTPLKIIAVTAQAMSETRDACLAAGCDALLSKPFEKMALLRLIRQVCQDRCEAQPEGSTV